MLHTRPADIFRNYIDRCNGHITISTDFKGGFIRMPDGELYFSTYLFQIHTDKGLLLGYACNEKRAFLIGDMNTEVRMPVLHVDVVDPYDHFIVPSFKTDNSWQSLKKKLSNCFSLQKQS